MSNIYKLEWSEATYLMSYDVMSELIASYETFIFLLYEFDNYGVVPIR